MIGSASVSGIIRQTKDKSNSSSIINNSKGKIKSKTKGKSRTKRGGELDDEQEDGDEQEELLLQQIQTDDQATETAWTKGGKHRDFVIQTLLRLVNNFGFYQTVETEAGYQEIFYKGTYARENVEGLREFLIDQEDKVSRDIMILIAKVNILPRFMIPLFKLALDDRQLALPLFRLFLLLTKPIDFSIRMQLTHQIRPKKGSESKEESLHRIRIESSKLNNAYSQLEALLAFKAALVDSDVLRVILAHSEESFGKDPDKRTPDDKIMIECTLMLISNLLGIKAAPYSTDLKKNESIQLQMKLINFTKDVFFDVVLLLSQTVLHRENKPWNLLLIEIVVNLINCFNMKDITSFFVDKSEDGLILDATRKSVVKNGLSDWLQETKQQRLAKINAVGARINRFGGVVKTNITSSIESSKGSHLFSKMLRSADDFMQPVCYRATNGRKKSRKAVVFSKNNIQKDSLIDANYDSETVSLTAYIATFIKSFLVSGFSELVISVKEAWRRNDILTFDEELCYFEFVTKCLQCNSAKIAKEKEKHMQNNNIPWMPDLKHITQCFDRMSLSKPAELIETIIERKQFNFLIVPVSLQKELIVGMRLLLESEHIAHNDICLHAIYRMFYHTEKFDPLPGLVRDWMPGKFPKEYTIVLLELIHETLKLLDEAEYCFRIESTKDPDFQEKSKKPEIERDIYLGGLQSQCFLMIHFSCGLAF